MLAPLTDPPSLPTRILHKILGGALTGALVSSLLVGNLVQASTLVLRPFSRRAFRKANRELAGGWWTWLARSTEVLYGGSIVVTGDAVPDQENALVLVNHQSMSDVPAVLSYARERRCVGDLKWFAKNSLRYVPAVGWGLAFLDCPFLKRDWARDQASIEGTFATLVRDRVPMWMVVFPEGTRTTAQKLEASQRWAAEQGLPRLEHVLAPRTKGFTASVMGLRSHITAVYDVSLGYEGGVPSLWQHMQGYAKRRHVHVRRFPIASLPADEAGLSRWLWDRFVEKDALLDGFYKTGRFG